MVFSKTKKQKLIQDKVRKFSERYGVRILSLANVGNHLHFHLKLSNRHTYKRFIRAITSAIAMGVTGKSRWNKIKGKFWDLRPFTRALVGLRGFITVRHYLEINNLEGEGMPKALARWILERNATNTG